MSDEEIEERSGSIDFAESVSDPLLDYPTYSPIEHYDLLRAWTLSFGQRDRSPVALNEVNLLKGRKGVALYQFALRRDHYHPAVTEEEAEGDTCGLTVPREAYFGKQVVSYLGVFINNRLRRVSRFDEWLLTA